MSENGNGGREAGRGPVIPHSKPYIDAVDVRAATNVLRSALLAQGKEVRAFEVAMAASLRQADGVAVSSGTAALHLALLGLGVRNGHAVAMPSYACAALLHAAEYVGATPVFVDIAKDDYNMDLVDLLRKVRANPLAAVVVPHTFGRVCDLRAIREAAGGDVPVIEDCAHALGDPHLGRGDALVCSFYATKMITTGEGGMVLSRRRTFLEDVRDLRDYDEKSNHRMRFNYKMTDVEAALGRSQLRKLPRFIGRRRILSRRYGREERTCYRWVVPVPKPARVVRAFEAEGIRARLPMLKALHRCRDLPDSVAPYTALAMERFVSIPLYPALTEAEVRRIERAIGRILG